MGIPILIRVCFFSPVGNQEINSPPDILRSSHKHHKLVALSLRVDDIQVVSSETPTRFVPPQPKDLNGRIEGYEVLEFIAAGGMGAVYKGVQTSLDRQVAIKITPKEFMKESMGPERFYQEAKILAALHHQNIAACHTYGEFTIFDSSFYYIILEYIEGESLRNVTDQNDISVTQAIDILKQVCEAVEFAHKKGVIHRDIKHDNIIIEKETGRAVLIDFGLAKVRNDNIIKELQSRTGEVLGTPEFAAPEIFETPDTDHRVDLYAIGVLAYFLLTGKLPKGRYKKPSSFGPSKKFDRPINKALAPDPEKRYQTPLEFSSALERASKHESNAKSRRRLLITLSGITVAIIALILWYSYDPKIGDGSTAGEEVTNYIGMKLCWIPAGTFEMGDPEGEPGKTEVGDSTPKEVTLTKGFWMGKFEVTRSDYERVMNGIESKDMQPWAGIKHQDAKNFCEKLTEIEKKAGKLREDYRYMLPTEAQWEYACRAGTTTVRYGQLDEVAWYIENCNGTKPVGQLSPNKWGLHDMLGNVREFCDNWFGEEPDGGKDPEGLSPEDNKEKRIPVRGGAFKSPASDCRAAFRANEASDFKDETIGFRVILSKK